MWVQGGEYDITLYGTGTFYLADVPAQRTASFEARSFTATHNGVRYTWDPSPTRGTWRWSMELGREEWLLA